MDAKSFLDSILNAGKDLVSQGQDLAAKNLGVPAEGDKKDATLSGLGKGAAIGGLLTMLVGTKVGRRLGRTALKYGSLAAMGGIAYKVVSDWQKNRDGELSGKPILELEGAAAQDRSLLLLKAMIGAAKADGHLDESEMDRIDAQIASMNLDAETVMMFKNELSKEPNVGEIAIGVDSPAAAAEIYLTSLMVLDVDNQAERKYLNDLAMALNLDQELVSQLEKEALTEV